MKFPEKYLKDLTFTKIPSLHPPFLFKIAPNEFFRDIDNNNRTPYFKEWLAVAASELVNIENNEVNRCQIDKNKYSTVLRCGSSSEKTSKKSTCAVIRIIITFAN